MSHSASVIVVENYFQALAEGRVAEALAAFADDVVWHQPGNNVFSGEHRGSSAVAALIGSMVEASDGTLVVAPAGPAMGNADLVAVPVHFSAQRKGRVLDQQGVDLLRVHEGKIVEVYLFTSNGPDEDEFWGQA